MLEKNKYWHLEGEELEDHLASDCQLSIIEPMQTTEYFTQEERELMNQFPKDVPTSPDYDDVYRLDPRLTDYQATVSFISMLDADSATAVGEPFRTARFWCLRVKHG